MTVEDPIEYELDGIGQTQVNPRIELTFARALRSILRQDPDVIMIGEIRDLETAQIAVQASLTGHLVLATLHTNDAASAVTRLADMGVEPYLLASSPARRARAAAGAHALPGLPRARAPRRPARRRWLADLGASRWPACTARRAATPAAAPATGAHRHLRAPGRRRGAAPADPRPRARARRCAPRRCAAGMAPLRRDGVRWIADGDTSLAELVRVTREVLTRSAAHARVSLRGGRRLGQAAARRARRRHAAPGARPAARRRALPDAIEPRGRRAATAGARPASRLRLPATPVALLDAAARDAGQSGMPLDQALAAVAEQADDARADEARRGGARRGRRRASRWPARSRAGRARSRTALPRPGRRRRRDRAARRRAGAPRRLPRGARGAEAEVHAGARSTRRW